MSSSHLFSLLGLYFSMFHDAKQEWEWTNLLLPERTEWAAASYAAAMQPEMEVYGKEESEGGGT